MNKTARITLIVFAIALVVGGVGLIIADLVFGAVLCLTFGFTFAIVALIPYKSGTSYHTTYINSS